MGKLKILETLRVEGLGWNLVEKTYTSPIYVIEITGTDSLSGRVGGRVNSEKLEKMRYF